MSNVNKHKENDLTQDGERQTHQFCFVLFRSYSNQNYGLEWMKKLNLSNCTEHLAKKKTIPLKFDIICSV